MNFFTPIKYKNEEFTYITPSWSDLNQLSFVIAKQIYEQEQKYDRIITLAKGGWPLTRSLVDFLQIDKVASIGVKFYQGINQRLEKPEIYQDIPVSIRGENILLFDDVADTGLSLKFTQDYLLTRGAETVATASLLYKPHSEIKPDFFGAETSAWIIFPYDVVEMINVLGNKWKTKGLDLNEIKKRFKELNFDQNWVDYYLHRFIK